MEREVQAEGEANRSTEIMKLIVEVLKDGPTQHDLERAISDIRSTTTDESRRKEAMFVMVRAEAHQSLRDILASTARPARRLSH